MHVRELPCTLYAKLTFGPGCQAVARKAECFGKYTGTRVPTNRMASFCVIVGIPILRNTVDTNHP